MSHPSPAPFWRPLPTSLIPSSKAGPLCVLPPFPLPLPDASAPVQPLPCHLRAAGVTSTPPVSPAAAPPELGQPSWILQGCRGLLQDRFSCRGTVPRRSRARPCGTSAGVLQEQGDPCTLKTGDKSGLGVKGGGGRTSGRVSPCRNGSSRLPNPADGSRESGQQEGWEALPGQRLCHPGGMADEPDHPLTRREVWQLPGPWQSEEEPLNTDSSVCKTQITRARRGEQGTDPGGTAKCVGWQRWHGTGRDGSGDKRAWSNLGHRTPSLCHGMKPMSPRSSGWRERPGGWRV